MLYEVGYLIRNRLFITLACAVVAWSAASAVWQFIQSPQGDLRVESAADSVRRLLILIPLLALTVAGSLSRAFLSPEFRQEDHLSGYPRHIRSTRVAAAVMALVATVAAAYMLVTLLVASVLDPWHEPIAGLVSPGDPAGSASSVLLATTARPLGWALVALGLLNLARPRTALVLCVMVVVAGGVLRLLAARYDVLQAVYQFSPAGAARTIVTTEALTLGVTRWQAAAVLCVWALLGLLCVHLRGHLELRVTPGLSKPPARRRVLGPTTRSAVVGLYAVAMVLPVVAGISLPTRLADSVPWHLKAEWRADVHAGTTPADRAAQLLERTRGSTRSEVQLMLGRDLAAREFRLLVRAARGRPPRNDTMAARPGRVLVDLGAGRETGGTIELPDQVGLCFYRSSGDWVLASILLNQTCEWDAS